jgi:TrmH family RNA methyltransferase
MVGKNQIKFIKSLGLKKNRIKYNKIVVEGAKTIKEFIDSKYKLDQLYSLDSKKINNIQPEIITKYQLKAISSQKTPNGTLAVFNIADKSIQDSSFYIVLDNISDPGNLGTIIRTCEWFGINQIICSNSSVDCYNPKVIQSSMGSLSRVNIIYTDIIKFLQSKNLPIYAADLEGQKFEKSKITDKCIWIFGSESHGISEKIKKLVDFSYTIPKYNEDVKTESLNLSSSLAIILSYSRI